MAQPETALDYGDVPSAVEWNALFAAKLDVANGEFTTSVLLKVYTVATLPTATTALKGSIAAVSDALTPSYRGVLTGGSTSVCMVICTGTAWLSC